MRHIGANAQGLPAPQLAGGERHACELLAEFILCAGANRRCLPRHREDDQPDLHRAGDRADIPLPHIYDQGGRNFDSLHRHPGLHSAQGEITESALDALVAQVRWQRSQCS